MNASSEDASSARPRVRPDARKLALWAALVLVIAGAAAAAIPLKSWWEESRVIARVNGEAITRGALQRMLADQLMVEGLAQELGGKEASSQNIQQLVLRELIVRRLYLQEAGRRGLVVGEQDVDKAVADLRARLKDEEAFRKLLATRGLDGKALREELRTEILVGRIQVMLMEGVRPTDEEIQAFYDAHKQGVAGSEELKLRIIMVKDKPTADEVSATLQRGADFGQIARQRSAGFHAKQGGDMGWVDPRFLPPPIGDAVRTLQVGVASAPLPGREGFYIVRIEEKRPGKPLPVEQVRAEIERQLLGTRQQQAVQAWLAEQEKKANIEVYP